MHLGSFLKGRGNHLDAKGPGIPGQEVSEGRVVQPAAVTLPSLGHCRRKHSPFAVWFSTQLNSCICTFLAWILKLTHLYQFFSANLVRKNCRDNNLYHGKINFVE